MLRGVLKPWSGRAFWTQCAVAGLGRSKCKGFL